MKAIISVLKWFFRICKENFLYKKRYNKCDIIIKNSELTVMSFNIRRDSDSDGIYNWQYRKESIIKMIHEYGPDIICMQEVMPHMAKYLIQELSGCYDYDSLECFTNGKLDKTWCFVGEGLLTFYKKNVFTSIDRKVIKLFDGRAVNVRRALSNTLHYNGEEIKVINTHFCPYDRDACRKSFEKLMLEYDENSTTRIFIAGDFNCETTWPNHGIKIFTEVFSHNKITQKGTINSYKDSNSNVTIDYIFSNQELKTSEVIYKEYDIKYLSDHYPLIHTY